MVRHFSLLLVNHWVEVEGSTWSLVVDSSIVVLSTNFPGPTHHPVTPDVQAQLQIGSKPQNDPCPAPACTTGPLSMYPVSSFRLHDLLPSPSCRNIQGPAPLKSSPFPSRVEWMSEQVNKHKANTVSDPPRKDSVRSWS